ncbi:MAG: protein BatD [Salinivirgaceae bacterium]|nr:protein BatD [Salinivirgaceae bacterium]
MKLTRIYKTLHLRAIAALVLLVFGVSLKASADDITFTANAPQVVEVGEQFRLQFVLNAKGSNFSEPNITDFQVLSGPNTSSSSSIQWVNGSMSQSTTNTYTFILMGDHEGKFTIPSATIKSGGKTYQSKPITIEVVAGSRPAAGSGNQGGQQSGGSTPAATTNPDLSSDDLFVAITVDKKKLYQGQYLVATIKLYIRNKDVSGFEDVKFPPFTGFWSSDLEAPQQIELLRENVNGQIYNTGLLKKVLLMPQRSGELTIDPMEITVLSRTRVRSNNPFDDFFGGSYRTTPYKLASKPVKINVDPLPAGKPADFSGGVGNFTLNASVDKTEVKANEAVTLKVKVSGTGNLKFINNIKIDFPPDIDVYDPKTTQNIKTDASGMSGSVTFDYLFIPRYAGNYRIAPITFSYFDTKTKTYKTLTTQEFNINVEKGEGDTEANSGVVQALTKEDVKFIGKDIRYIKPISQLDRKQALMFGTPLFYGCYAIPLLIFVAIILFRLAQIKQNANQAAVKNRKAGKVSRKRLRQASKYMKQGQEAQFYDELLKGIWGYLSDKLSIPVANLSKDNVTDILAAHNVDSQLVGELMDLLNSCEFARYAPAAVSGGMDEIFRKADDTLSKLDQKVK